MTEVCHEFEERFKNRAQMLLHCSHMQRTLSRRLGGMGIWRRRDGRNPLFFPRHV